MSIKYSEFDKINNIGYMIGIYFSKKVYLIDLLFFKKFSLIEKNYLKRIKS
jgi:hypothetical protein